MAIEVAKVELKNVQDASGVETAIRNGQFKADEVIAVIGKTEGNGGVNDFTRILADQAFRAVLKKHGSRPEAGEHVTQPRPWQLRVQRQDGRAGAVEGSGQELKQPAPARLGREQDRVQGPGRHGRKVIPVRSGGVERPGPVRLA